MILNGGGVTVSYFEWLKNLQHVNPGRLTKRWEAKIQKNLYSSIVKTNLDQHVIDSLRGADEKDIVYSGLEEIMCHTMRYNWELSKRFEYNVRTAAFVSSIERVAEAYKYNGLTF